MSKHLSNPIVRLICMGAAKASTMAVDEGQPENDIGGPLFE